jgi:hypothetical protein
MGTRYMGPTFVQCTNSRVLHRSPPLTVHLRDEESIFIQQFITLAVATDTQVTPSSPEMPSACPLHVICFYVFLLMHRREAKITKFCTRNNEQKHGTKAAALYSDVYFHEV